MKRYTRVMALAVCASLAMPLPAQTPVTPAPASTPPPGASQQGGKSFSQGELDQLLAPIAL